VDGKICAFPMLCLRAHIGQISLQGFLFLSLDSLPVHNLCQDGVRILGCHVFVSGLHVPGLDEPMHTFDIHLCGREPGNNRAS
jgi:hypothetical protein